MSDFDRLVQILRRRGFITGLLTEDDKESVSNLLLDLWAMFDPAPESRP